jgi:hypothetical protein
MSTQLHLSPSTRAHRSLLSGLLGIEMKIRQLYLACELAHQQLRVLDGAPRHDTLLDDETVKTLTAWPYDALRNNLSAVEEELKTSEWRLCRASEHIRGYFTGDLKVQAEDRLNRHLAEANKLLALFSELRSEYQPPNRPYLIRKQTLSGLLPLLSVIKDLLRDVRVTMKQEELDRKSYCALEGLIATAFRLRAQVARWRDNPSQKMAQKIDAWFEQVKAFREAFRTLHARSMLECLRDGVKIPGRGGPWSVLMVSAPIKRALLIEYPDQSEAIPEPDANDGLYPRGTNVTQPESCDRLKNFAFSKKVSCSDPECNCRRGCELSKPSISM